WVDYPDTERERAIVQIKSPNAGACLQQEVAASVQRLRAAALFKVPGVAETTDWDTALVELDRTARDPALAADTLGVLLKYQGDVANIQGEEASRILDQIKDRVADI